MGMLVDGTWQDEDRFMADGAYRRRPSGLANPSADHLADLLVKRRSLTLIASGSCPWSHRVILVRALKALDRIPVVAAGGPRIEGYRLLPNGRITINGAPPLHLHELYSATDRHHTGRATVPLIWDQQREVVVCNESSVIARALDMLDAEDGWRLAPSDLRSEIDTLNGRIFHGLSNAVYRAGLATRQSAYDTAVRDVFATLDWLEARLSKNRCLFGAQITEADLFLYASLVRFDMVYATHFRCTRARLVDYPALWAYARDIHAWPGIAATVDFQAIREGYYVNDGDNNPHGIVAEAPERDWNAAHGRERFGPLCVATSAGLRMLPGAHGP